MSRNRVCLNVFLVLICTPLLAAAESDAVRAIYLSAGNVPTNVATVHTYPEPPKGFNPLTASAEELASYGFPQRPDKQAHPDHYALWERAMQAAKIRWHGELKPIPLNRLAPTPVHVSEPSQAIQPPTTTQKSDINAAGVVLNNGRTSWSNSYSFNDIWTVITVPFAQLPFDNATGCTDTDYFLVSAAGIDGQIGISGGRSVFLSQEAAGVFENAYCPAGSLPTVYEAVVGWDNLFTGLFSLNPGDLFYTELHAFGGCNNGSAFVEDLTTLTFSSYTIYNPCAVTQIGRFANWIVWRQIPNPGAASPLANTIDIPFDGAAAQNGIGTRFYPGSQAASTQILTMTDDAGDQAIEVVNQGSSGYQGQHSLWFQTTGCAFSGGCTP